MPGVSRLNDSASHPLTLQHIHRQYPGKEKEDLTLYYRCKSTIAPKVTKKESEDFDRLAAALVDCDSIDLTVKIPKGKFCRGLACWCDDRTSIAITLRDAYVPAKVSWVAQGLLPPLPSPKHIASEMIAGRICGLNNKPTGLVVVAGQTGSGKSTLADGIFRELLSRPASRDLNAHRHIIALGKPVDWSPYPDKETAKSPIKTEWQDEGLGSMYSRFGIQYTPRTLGVDTNLEQALIDALRQKPDGIYLDEIRNESDWPAVLRFAESGHLVVTTAHAGSIRDIISWIFRAMKVERRSQAPAVAKNILAIVHTKRPGQFPEPELWIGEKGAKQLAAYGMGSLIPANDTEAAYIGRTLLHNEILEIFARTP